MIDVAIEIVKKHIEEYYPNEGFNMANYSKEYTFYSSRNWNIRIVLGLVNNEILFGMSNLVRKKKILEKQLRLIGAMKYSEKWI